jgi:hypothetical protein
VVEVGVGAWVGARVRGSPSNSFIGKL